MSATDLKDVGHLVRGLSPKEFSEIPTTTFTQLDDAAFSDLTCMQFDKAQCRAIVKKVLFSIFVVHVLYFCGLL